SHRGSLPASGAFPSAVMESATTRGLRGGRSHLYLIYFFFHDPAVPCAASRHSSVSGDRVSGSGSGPCPKERAVCSPQLGPFLGARATFLRFSLTGAEAPALLLGGAVADEA
uniref:Uncharacterized protein n=1 Tax=Otus sunia TaxID=257818 RepID=A0A8C8E6E7_9STRI